MGPRANLGTCPAFAACASRTASSSSTSNLRPRIESFIDSEYPLIIEELEASRRRLKFLLCGYVLMPDHWHALIWPSYPLLISQVLHDIKACPEQSEGKGSAAKLHARRGSKGPFWQHQFWDRFVRHEKEFKQRLEYIHMNPVREGLVKRPQDWSRPAGSSYNNFALHKATVAACPIQIDYVRLPEGYRG